MGSGGVVLGWGFVVMIRLGALHRNSDSVRNECADDKHKDIQRSD